MHRYVASTSCLTLALCACAVWPVQAAPDIPQAEVQTTNQAIPPMPLKEALGKFAQREHLQLVYVSTIAAGVRTRGAPAGLSLQATLKKLLEGTGLAYRFLNSKTVKIYSPANPQPSGGAPASKQQSAPEEASPEPTELAQVTVTGSHIRGAPPASLTIDIDQQQMIQAGQTDLGEAIRSLPQNFSGGQNPGVAPGGGITNQNITGGSAPNLRGLGADATLTLLNGRRLSFDGFTQAVDISQIPLAAVDRIEVVADGASAIYGSDAVAGVVNVILKPDYEGLSVTARLGGATSGGDFEQQYSAVGGAKWSTGGFIATASYEKVTDVDAKQRNYTSYLSEPYTLLSAGKVRSMVFSAHQQFGAMAEFKLDALYSKRGSHDATNLSGIAISRSRKSVDEYVISPTLTLHLPGSWSLSVNGTHARDKFEVDQWASLLGGATLLDGARTCYCNRTGGWEIDSEGSLFRLPGGDARVALGGGYRKNSFLRESASEDTSLGGLSAQNRWMQQHSYYAFGELYLPMVSPSLDIHGIHELSLNVALRRERYNTFGGVTTPKVGVIYAPTADFSLKASWGKSFKTPTLTQQFSPLITYLWNTAMVGGIGYPGSATALMMDGGNPNLEPERAKTWGVTLGLHPEVWQGFRAELAYFHIDYDRRVIQGVSNQQSALGNPAYQPFVNLNPTSEQIRQAVESAGPDFLNYANVPYDPGDVVAIINNRYANIAAWKIHGLDLLANYEFGWGRNTLRLSGNVSWLQSEQQTTPVALVVNLAGTVFNPPNWHTRFSATWMSGPLVLSAYYTYIGAVTDIMSQPHVDGDSMQTVDLTGTWHFADELDVSMSVKNLTNQRPPYLMPVSPGTVNFDSTNYSPIGRYIGVTLTKRWR